VGLWNTGVEPREVAVTSLDGISVTIERLREVELKLAELYLLCARRWESQRLFWEGIANDERQHAAYLSTMRELVESAPGDYCVGRPFNPAAIQTMLGYFDSVARKIDEGSMGLATVANVARDIEHSLLESKYVELVRTKDPRYLTLVQQIDRDTARHRNLMDERTKGPS
jgi:hypothetical protein